MSWHQIRMSRYRKKASKTGEEGTSIEQLEGVDCRDTLAIPLTGLYPTAVIACTHKIL